MRLRTFGTFYIVLLALFMIVLSSGLATAVELANTNTNTNTDTNSIGMQFVLIPAGTFMMGADKDFAEASDYEQPRHQVTISKPFYLGVYNVTQKDWTAVMGNNPSKCRGEDNPVETVSWKDIQDFIKRLNQKEGHSRYRLPTEAEWEYAARAGSTSTYFFGDDKSQLGDYAWYYANSGDETHPVGQKRPNAWGLYDILGNVFEWTGDWWGDTYYAKSPSSDPTGPTSGAARVLRSCGWGGGPWDCRSSVRGRGEPADRHQFFGFRLALSSEGNK
jgi:formylglycine-generating enzyme required for sulfatase activity